ncbi:hypothetical protein Tco_1505025 [Tanacetum coccineum]
MKESCWIESMQDEIHEFERLEVWELVPRPSNVMLINLKWIFKVKYDEYGKLCIYARIEVIHIFIAYVKHKNMMVFQMDMKTAILNGLMQNQAASTSTKPPTKNDWDLLFQPIFDEYFKPLSVVSTSISAATLPSLETARASLSTIIDKDAPSLSTSPNNETATTLILSTNVEEPNKEKKAEYDSDTFTNPFAPPETSAAESSSKIVDTLNMHTFQQPHINTKR